MPGYEALSLFNGFLGSLNTILFGYVSILSAFLVMTYFAAERLNLQLMILVLILFTAACFSFILQFNLIKSEMASLHAYMLDLKKAGDPSLQWFGENPSQSILLLTIFQNIVTIGGYFGCIVFFLYQRYQSRG